MTLVGYAKPVLEVDCIVLSRVEALNAINLKTREVGFALGLRPRALLDLDARAL